MTNYNAGDDFTAGDRPRFNADLDAVTVSSHIVDLIQSIRRPLPMPNPLISRDPKLATRWNHDMAEWLIRISDLISSDTLYHTGEPVFSDVVARTLIGNTTHMATPADGKYIEGFSAFLKLFRRGGLEDDTDYNEYATPEMVRLANIYISAFNRIGPGEEFITFGTANSYFGLGPPKMEKNDLVCVFVGFRTPFIIRKRVEGGYRLVGECNLHGLMNGEGLKMGEAEEIVLF